MKIIKNKINKIIKIIIETYSDKKIELNYETPFQLLIAVILSAQTTDIQVNKVTKDLFKKIKTPEDIKNISISEIKKYINKINFFNNKARFIHKTWLKLEKDFNSVIPNTLEELTSLSWVWVKTAKVVLNQLYNKPFIAVDTHVHRVCNRTWIVKTKTPEQTDKLISNIFTEEQKRESHHAFVLFGRYICKAKKPECKKCPLFKNNLCKNAFIKTNF